MTERELLLRLAWRSPSTSVALLVAMALVAVVTSATARLGAGAERALQLEALRLGADLIAVPDGVEVPLQSGLVGGIPTTARLPSGTIERIAADPQVVSASPQYFLTSAPASCCEAGNLFLVGFDPSADRAILPRVVQQAEASDAIYLGSDFTRPVGSRFRFYGHGFEVAGLLDATGLAFFDNSVFVPLASMRIMEESSLRGEVRLEVDEDTPSLLLIQIAPDADIEATRGRLDGEGYSVVAADSLRVQLRRRLDEVMGLVGPLAAALLAVTALLGAAAQTLYWLGRKQVLGLVLALGLPRQRLLAWVLLWSGALGAAGALIGLVAGRGLLALFTPYVQVVVGLPLLDQGVPPAGVATALVVFGATTLVPPWLVLHRTLRADPYALIRASR